jgi:hypothetical protein
MENLNNNEYNNTININNKPLKIIKNNNIINNQKILKNESYNQNKSYERMLEQILTISYDLNNKISELTLKFDTNIDILNNKINKLDENINNIENKIIDNIKSSNIDCIEDLKELVNESLDINKEDVLKALYYRDYRSIINIFRLYYKNINNIKYVYPIRQIKIKKFEYYCNKKWNPDLYGYYCMNVICLNIQNLFIKYNNLDSDDISDEDFILNQNFIFKLSDDKYKKDIFKNIIEELKINL